MLEFEEWLQTISETSYDKDLDPDSEVIVIGVKGSNDTPFKKMFKNMDAYDKWTESDDFDDCEVYEVINKNEGE